MSLIYELSIAECLWSFRELWKLQKMQDDVSCQYSYISMRYMYKCIKRTNSRFLYVYMTSLSHWIHYLLTLGQIVLLMADFFLPLS